MRQRPGSTWAPVNGPIILIVLHDHLYGGDEFEVERPTGSGRLMTLRQVSDKHSHRLANIFLQDEYGRRPVLGGTQKFREVPHWRDLVLFSEKIHGDDGAGLGANGPAGWTGSAAHMRSRFATTTPEHAPEFGMTAVIGDERKPKSGEPSGAVSRTLLNKPQSERTIGSDALGATCDGKTSGLRVQACGDACLCYFGASRRQPTTLRGPRSRRWRSRAVGPGWVRVPNRRPDRTS